MSWFYFSLLSITALALGDLTQQHILNSSSRINERMSGALTFFVQSMATIPIILILGLTPSFFEIFSKGLYPNLLVVTVIGSTALLFYLKSFKVKNISISTILVSSSVIVSTFLGIVFFKESINLYKFIGIAFILGAIFYLNFRNSIIEKNHIYGLFAGLLFGTMYTLDKSIVINTHPIIYIFWAFLLTSIFAFSVGIKENTRILTTLTFTDFKPILISAAGYFFYNICTFFAYKVGGEVGRVDAINNSQVFLIILVEYFVFKQREEILKKVLSATAAIFGILILGNF